MRTLAPRLAVAQDACMQSGPRAASERRIQRWHKGQAESLIDTLVVEEPLELRAHDRSLAVIMRTPGHDEELVRGLLHAEGLIRPGEDEWLLTQSDDNVVTLEMADEMIASRWAQRNVISNSACGVCGASALAVLDELATPIRSDLVWTSEDVLSVTGKLRASQALFAATGALHGAALFNSAAELLVCREDVGRHNAVDKVVGWSLATTRTLGQCVLAVSSRLSYEIVHKAVAAGIPMIIAVSAPSSLAVDLGERWCVTLVGFTRDQGFNVYSHSVRIQS